MSAKDVGRPLNNGFNALGFAAHLGHLEILKMLVIRMDTKDLGLVHHDVRSLSREGRPIRSIVVTCLITPDPADKRHSVESCLTVRSSRMRGRVASVHDQGRCREENERTYLNTYGIHLVCI